MPKLQAVRKLVRRQIRGRHLAALNKSEGSETTCLNCGTRFVGNYCPNCGQSAKVGKLSIRYGITDLLGIVTNIDRGFLHTCFELIYRPGYMMRDYIDGHRKEYIKPMQLIFILGTVMLVFRYLLYGYGIEPGEVMSQEMIEDSGHQRLWVALRDVMEWLRENRSALYLLLVTMIVFPNWLCFHWVNKRRRLNLSEHFFVSVYIGCQLLMLHILEMPFERIGWITDGYNLSVPFAILVFDFVQLFGIRIWRSVRLSFTSLLLSFALFLILVISGALLIAYYVGEMGEFTEF